MTHGIRIGSFTAGGRFVRRSGLPRQTLDLGADIGAYVHDPNGTYLIEQAYVQSFVPEGARGLPYVLVHGGGLSGSCWETTPDGRPGWLAWLLERERAVYVVDEVERGRAGFVPDGGALDGEWQGQPVARSLEEAWQLFRFGPPEAFAARTPFPGCRFPVGALEALAGRFVPRWPDNRVAQRAALAAALDRIGRCVLVAHSQGCLNALQLAATHPSPAATVLIEPAGAPERLETLGPGRPVLQIWGDYTDRHALWGRLEAHSAARHRAWRDEGADSGFWRLPEAGIRGNSHMPMMDDNAEAILERVLAWADRHAIAPRA